MQVSENFVDALAQEIRRVDGNHDKGAASLAEALVPFLTAALPVEARKGGAVNRMLLEQMLQNAFFAGRGTSGIVSPEDMAAWQDYDYTKLEAYKRLRSSLEAAALSDAEPVANGWTLRHDNFKRWCIFGPDDRWYMQPVGMITADEAKSVCERAIRHAPQTEEVPEAVSAIRRAITLIDAMRMNDPNEPVSDAGHVASDLWTDEVDKLDIICKRLEASASSSDAMVKQWPIETDDQVDALARECDWDNRKYMTPKDYAIWCERMRKFARLASLSVATTPPLEETEGPVKTPSAVAVKVKPLEWIAIDGGNAFRAPALIFGWIRIETYTLNSWQVQWSVPGICNILLPSVFDTPDEAKAAAQADYEARIRSALSAQVQDVAGWQDISTLEPKDGMIVMGWGEYRERDGFSPAFMRWYDSVGGWNVNAMQFYPTHWMPLPAAPAKQEG